MIRTLTFALLLLARAVAAQEIADDSVLAGAAATDSSILSADDVRGIVEKAASSVDTNTLVIAVTDRQGNILALYRKPNAPVTAIGNFSAVVDANELAVALARTTSFFSNGQAPLSTRTVRYISGIHFPPGVAFTGNAALYGIENTNRGCGFNVTFLPGKEVPPARSIDGTKPGLGILTGKKDLLDSDPAAVNPGGVPLYKNGKLVGGIGVAGADAATAEYAAFMGSVGAGFGPVVAPPGVVVIDGIALPFVDQATAPRPAGPASGSYVIGPNGSPAADPEGDLMTPRSGSALTAAEVAQILSRAVDASNQTRAMIRLPLGSRARMAIAVADLDGSILGLHRMTDSTFFSLDVAVAKARNVIYFSGKDGNKGDLKGVPAGTAVTNRTIGYGAQPLYPPGIDYSSPGPFYDLYKFDALNPCTQGSQAPNPNQNGIIFFPGSLPLYKNGVLVGGLGVSGDGVEQDDYVTASGAFGFEAPVASRADRVIVDQVRLPYLKFPRNPTN